MAAEQKEGGGGVHGIYPQPLPLKESQEVSRDLHIDDVFYSQGGEPGHCCLDSGSLINTKTESTSIETSFKHPGGSESNSFFKRVTNDGLL